MAEQLPPADVAPGAMEGAPQQVPQGEGAAQDPAQQVAVLVSGVNDGMNLLRSLLESTPGAPPEAQELLAQSMEAFSASMQMLVGDGSDEEMAEPERAPEGVAAQQQMAAQGQNQRQFIPKNMGTL